MILRSDETVIIYHGCEIDKIFVLNITFRAKTEIHRDRILSQSLTLMIVSLSYNVYTFNQLYFKMGIKSN